MDASVVASPLLNLENIFFIARRASLYVINEVRLEPRLEWRLTGKNSEGDSERIFHLKSLDFFITQFFVFAVLCWLHSSEVMIFNGNKQEKNRSEKEANKSRMFREILEWILRLISSDEN